MNFVAVSRVCIKWVDDQVEQQKTIDNRQLYITQTLLFKDIENFTAKKGKFSDKKILIFFIFLLKT